MEACMSPIEVDKQYTVSDQPLTLSEVFIQLRRNHSLTNVH